MKRPTCGLLSRERYKADLVLSGGLAVPWAPESEKKRSSPFALSNDVIPETFRLSRFTDGCLVSESNRISTRYWYSLRSKRASTSITCSGLSCQRVRVDCVKGFSSPAIND